MRAMGSVAGSKLGVPVVMQLHEGAMQPSLISLRAGNSWQQRCVLVWSLLFM